MEKPWKAFVPQPYHTFTTVSAVIPCKDFFIYLGGYTIKQVESRVEAGRSYSLTINQNLQITNKG